MEQLKVFFQKAGVQRGDDDEVVKQANAWLQAEGDKITITHREITCSASGAYLTIWIFYVPRR